MKAILTCTRRLTLASVIWHMILETEKVTEKLKKEKTTGPTRVSPNGILIGSAVFAQFTRVPNTQTHGDMLEVS